MTSNRDITNGLAGAGRAPIEPIEPRLDALEARLMATIADDDLPGVGVIVAGGVSDVAARRRTRRARLTLMTAAAAIVAVVVLAFTVPSGGDDIFVIAAADEVSVVLPDGSTVAGSRGLELPDGARIDVMGALRVGDVSYGPGSYVVTPDGVVPLLSTTTTSTPRARSTSTSMPAERAVPSTTGVADGNLVDASTTDVTTILVDSDRQPRPTRTDADRVAPASTRPRSDRPTTTSPPPATRPPVTRPPPTTVVPVTRPTSTVADTRPATTVSDIRPATTVAVTRPTTTVRATTAPPATRPPAAEPQPAPTRAPTTTTSPGRP